MKCKAGDLAIVIDAINPENIGRIVNVVRLQNEKDDLKIEGQGTIWYVKAFNPMTWTVGKVIHHASAGPVPDSYLHPIRGSLNTDLNEHQTARRRFCFTISLRNAEINKVSPDTWRIDRLIE
jgi:hypothetical protein